MKLRTAQILAILWLLSGCSRSVSVKSPDFEMLMRHRDCHRVLEEQPENSSPMIRGGQALCKLVTEDEQNPISARTEAIQILTSGNGETDTAISAIQMIRFASDSPTPAPFSFQLLVLETAIQSVGYGTQGHFASPEPRSTAAIQLAITTLEFLSSTLHADAVLAPQDRIVNIWNACYSLLGGVLSMPTDRLGWQLHISLADLAILLFDADRPTDFHMILMKSAIDTIHENPGISVAARCDLSARYETFKRVLAQRLDLLSSLERAVAVAVGCTRGRYAPLE